MRLRLLFSEMPYAGVLKEDVLRSRCSMCFAKSAATRCSNDCAVVTYCDDQCMESDRRAHKFECVAFKSNPSRSIDKFLRLLGRILTRQMVDGGIVNLCENFPTNIPDRCLSDLMSHQAEIEGSKRRLKEMNETLAEFHVFYRNTPLVDDWELVRRMYCVMWINCFSVCGPMNLTKGFEASLGLGFYLNTSRFNHSCVPELHVDFDGSRLGMYYASEAVDDADAVKERSMMTGSADEFNRLTISYGFSQSFSNDSFFPIRQQRRESLRFVYYFQCHCALCDDEVEAGLEKHAAAINCSRCDKAYVWRKVPIGGMKCWPVSTKSKITCLKTCKCEETSDERKNAKKLVKSVDARETLVDLEQGWDKATSFRLKDFYANQIIDIVEPVWMKARKVWDPSANLRFAHLAERLFVSYRVMVVTTLQRNDSVDARTLQMGLVTGEQLLSWCHGRPFNMFFTAAAAYANDLAQLYETAATVEEWSENARDLWNRASFWYVYAASIWESHGKPALRFADQLRAQADSAMEMASAEETVEADEQKSLSDSQEKSDASCVALQ